MGLNRRSKTPNRGSPVGFFGMRDWAHLKAGIRDFGGKGERDSGL